MAITKSEFLSAMGTFKGCADNEYCKKSELGYNVIVSDTEPTNAGHWIKPEEPTGAVVKVSKIVVSTTQPTDPLAAWIQPIS